MVRDPKARNKIPNFYIIGFREKLIRKNDRADEAEQKLRFKILIN